MRATTLLAALGLLCSATAQPFQPHAGVAPLGSLRTSDYDGPYNLTMLSAQANECQAGAAARGYKGGISDKDIVDFLVNVECLEGLFDTWGVFGQGFVGDLTLGGPVPKGARQADLSEEVRTKLAEVALNEQGHALLTRHAGGQNPCPEIDFDKGFNDIMAAAFDLKGTVKKEFGAPFDPFKNDQNFILSMLTLEELGATGNKGLIGIITNPVLANAVAGLATSATAQAAIERNLLWDRRTEIIEPFGETAQQVFARISAYRDSMDGGQIHDQGLVNTDPRFIYVPFHGINLIPTDIRGLTYNRSPQMNINILTLGAKDGKGGFFPKGIHGKIKTPEGYDGKADGLADWPTCAPVAVQQSVEDTGTILPPIYSADDDTSVHGMEQLTQPLDGKRIGKGADGRGMQDVPASNEDWQKRSDGKSVKPDIPANSGKLEHSSNFCGDCTGESGGSTMAGRAAEAMRNVADDVKDTVTGSGSSAEASARQAAGSAQQMAEGTRDTIAGTANAAGSSAERTARQAAGSAQKVASDAQDTVKRAAGDAQGTDAERTAKGAASSAQQATEDTVKRTTGDTVSGHAQKAAGSAQNMASDVSDTVKRTTGVNANDAAKAADDSSEATKDIAQRVANYARETANAVGQKTKDAKDAALGGGQKAADDSQQAAQELAQRAADYARETANTASQKTRYAKDASKGGRKAAEEAAQAARDTAQQAEDYARETANTASRKVKGMKGAAAEGGKSAADAANDAAQYASKKVKQGADVASNAAEGMKNKAKDEL